MRLRLADVDRAIADPILRLVFIKLIAFFTVFKALHLLMYALMMLSTYVSLSRWGVAEIVSARDGPNTWTMQVDFFRGGILPHVIVGHWLLAGAYVVAGVGLGRLRNWARRLTIALTAVWVVYTSAIDLLTHDWQTQPFGLSIELFLGVVFYGLIIWYLLRPRVKEDFGVRKPN